METDVDDRPRAGRAVVLVMLGVAVAVAVYFAFGMPGMDPLVPSSAAERGQMMS